MRDRAEAEQLWSAPPKSRFPDGLDTPGLPLTRCVASAALHRTPPVGEPEVVDLH
ncbi:hypothetical protein [Virgisporangium aliadipatigenens]|uniref:hypothetical protein n=1 Tax=Virgisporangium aliadipatigenens TaxID=741659 RepID=UPI001941EE02|nr:hypothetical protein [Virgisporangium aliadipatigenens]